MKIWWVASILNRKITQIWIKLKMIIIICHIFLYLFNEYDLYNTTRKRVFSGLALAVAAEARNRRTTVEVRWPAMKVKPVPRIPAILRVTTLHSTLTAVWRRFGRRIHHSRCPLCTPRRRSRPVSSRRPRKASTMSSAGAAHRPRRARPVPCARR